MVKARKKPLDASFYKKDESTGPVLLSSCAWSVRHPL